VKVIRVKRTITLTSDCPLESYPGQTAEEAVEWERGMDRSEKVESFAEILSAADFDKPGEADFAEVVTIEEVEDDGKHPAGSSVNETNDVSYYEVEFPRR
jgi:hypothetical protein